VRARRFDVHVLDILGRQPGAHFAIDINQTVVRITRNPKQMQLLSGLGVQRGEFFVKLFGDVYAFEPIDESTGAESADLGKLVQAIQAR
jgi:hypothetical protein